MSLDNYIQFTVNAVHVAVAFDDQIMENFRMDFFFVFEFHTNNYHFMKSLLIHESSAAHHRTTIIVSLNLLFI